MTNYNGKNTINERQRIESKDEPLEDGHDVSNYGIVGQS